VYVCVCVVAGVITLAGYEVTDGPGEFMLLLKHRTEKRELLVEVKPHSLTHPLTHAHVYIRMYIHTHSLGSSTRTLT
jgi:hypothetical protein